MPLPEIAPMDLRESISVKLWKEKLSANATLRHVMAQDRISTAFGEKSTEGFTTVDLGLAARPVSGIQVSLGVQNLFDVAYREHLNRFIRAGVPLLSTGRNFVLMAAYQF
jgi:iron complex outermembrane receptor protein